MLVFKIQNYFEFFAFFFIFLAKTSTDDQFLKFGFPDLIAQE